MRAHDVLVKNAAARGENQAGIEAADQTRRRFLKLNLFALALAPTVGFFASEIAWGGRTARIVDNSKAILDPSDPQAQALSYIPQSTKEGQSCSNCQLYTGVEGEERGPCAIFSYRVAPTGKQLLVNSTGWCRAWAPRQPL